jgi:microcystin-dependent protein
MSEFLGEIRAFDSGLPEGWLPCDGRELPINGNVHLYSVLGARFGGDGESKFALPDLRGRVPAGTDPRAGIEVGDTTGHGGEDPALIPYETVRWGICNEGQFPLNR